jgi:hypothetical protein
VARAFSLDSDEVKSAEMCEMSWDGEARLCKVSKGPPVRNGETRPESFCRLLELLDVPRDNGDMCSTPDELLGECSTQSRRAAGNVAALVSVDRVQVGHTLPFTSRGLRKRPMTR